jgi:hypothetical protein
MLRKSKKGNFGLKILSLRDTSGRPMVMGWKKVKSIIRMFGYMEIIIISYSEYKII